MQTLPAQETGRRLRGRENLKGAETAELESLRREVVSLRSEVETLKDFVKALYSMIDEDGCGGSEELPPSANYGRIET